MSRSNYDKPFYVDVGTSIAAIRCASNHDVISETDHHGSNGWVKWVEEICERMNREAELFYAPTGNAAAMREAMLKAIVLCNDAIEGGEYMGEGPDPNFGKIKELLSGALSAPPRNCDVGTADEQEKRYHATGELYHIPTLKDVVRWEQMPYEEGAGK